MSLFSSFKKALGFPDEFDDLDDLSDLEDKDEPHEAGVDTASTAMNRNSVSAADRAVENKEILDEKLRISVTKLFSVINNTDEEATFISICNDYCDGRLKIALSTWNDERDKLMAEIAELKKKTSDCGMQVQELETYRLSSVRQKRAFSDKMSEMEKMISALEVEREQLMIQNDSMLKKLRGRSMPVVQSTNDDNGDIARLAAENASLKKELNNLKCQLAHSERERSKLESEQSQQITIEELRQLEKKISKVEKVNADKDNKITSLNATVSEQQRSINDLSLRLSESESQRADQLRDIDVLNNTIKQNLEEHAVSEANLNAEIRRLTDMINATELITDKKSKRGRKTKTDNAIAEVASTSTTKQSLKISAIDELMDNTDWFTAPAPGPREKDPEVTENFGYKEQPRKTSKNHDKNQLTLF